MVEKLITIHKQIFPLSPFWRSITIKNKTILITSYFHSLLLFKHYCITLLKITPSHFHSLLSCKQTLLYYTFKNSDLFQENPSTSFTFVPSSTTIKRNIFNVYKTNTQFIMKFIINTEKITMSEKKKNIMKKNK